MTNQNEKKKLFDLVEQFKTCMLTTQAQGDSLHARPMFFADITDENCIWFISKADQVKVDEAQETEEALITAQDETSAYLALRGKIKVVQDKTRVSDLWSPHFQLYFPEGPESDDIALLKFTPTFGEYWSMQGAESIRYLYEAGKALVRGEALDHDAAGEHAAVPLQ